MQATAAGCIPVIIQGENNWHGCLMPYFVGRSLQPMSAQHHQSRPACLVREPQKHALQINVVSSAVDAICADGIDQFHEDVLEFSQFSLRLHNADIPRCDFPH